MAAFGQIYERYRVTVFKFVYYRCGNRTLAEDLTSQTFLRGLQRIGSLTWQGRDVGAWLVTIARNLVADHFKSGRYQREQGMDGRAIPHLPEFAVLMHPGQHEPPDPAEEATAAELQLAIRLALRELNDRHRTVIELRFFDELSVEETACKMGIKIGAVKALQYRAVRALARLPQIQALDPGLVPA